MNASVSAGNRTLLAELSLSVSAGEVVALIGPNGAGKTTALRAALGIVPLGTGMARLGDDDPSKLSPRERALRAAYLPQRPQTIWPVSVEALAALGRFAHGAAPQRLSARDRQAVDQALEACQLTQLRARRMNELSGGEKARAHLARALAQGAQLLVLDEPTASLDPAQAISCGGIARAHAARGGGVLFATHDLTLAVRVANRVVLMADGRAVAAGAPQHALTEATLTAAYGRPGKLVPIEGELTAVFS
jgi:iron complex transport system ATP-binding protein